MLVGKQFRSQFAAAALEPRGMRGRILQAPSMKLCSAGAKLWARERRVWMKAVETLSRGVQSMGAPTGGPDCRALAASPIKTGSGRGLTPK